MAGPLPSSYAEARAGFRAAASAAGVAPLAHPLEAAGPAGEELTVDTVSLGAADAVRHLVVLSGVHGVEAFAPSLLQSRFLGRWADRLPGGLAVHLVHVVNPWGMAWGRRQNEHNVDLNRNWRRSDHDPEPNDAYDEIHPIACPDTDELPGVADLIIAAGEVVARRGEPWVREAITRGQYRHPDGLHYGGDETEPSNRILEDVLTGGLAGAETVLTLDLHTGDGPVGAMTLLSRHPPSSPAHALLAGIAGSDRIHADGDGRPRPGRIAPGIADLVPGAAAVAATVEFGSSPDEAQLAATYQEQWLWRRGDRTDPAARAVIDAYRWCFTPANDGWARRVVELGDRLLDAAVRAAAAPGA